MNVKQNQLAELQQVLNNFKIEREKLQKECDLPFLFSEFTPCAKLMLANFTQRADRLYLELYLIVEQIKSEKNG